MKKEIILLLLSINLAIAAPSIILKNQNPQPKEPVLLQIDIPNPIRDIQEEDIVVLRGRVQTYIETDLVRFNQTFFLCLYPQKSENLTLKIFNITYKENSTIKQTVLIQNLTISKNPLKEDNKTNYKILSIHPACIKATKPSFTLSNKGTTPLKIKLPEKEITLQPEEFTKIFPKPSETLTFYKISTYKEFIVPIILINTTTTKINHTTNKTRGTLSTNMQSLSINTTINNNQTFSFRLFNTGNTTITNISFSGPEILLFHSPKNLSGKNTTNATIKLIAKKVGIFEGSFELTYIQENKTRSLSFPYSIYIVPKGSNPKNITFKKQKCSSLGGKICPEGEECAGKVVFTEYRETCCMDTCKKIEMPNKESSSGTLLGIVIFIVLGIIAYLVYKKFKSTKPPTPEEKLKKIAQQKPKP